MERAAVFLAIAPLAGPANEHKRGEAGRPAIGYPGLPMAAGPQDPYAKALRDYCAQKPGAVEDRRWGETVFKIGGRVFAFLGRRDRACVTVKAPPEDADALLEHPAVRRARWVGPFGWISLDVGDDETLELARGLIDDSYELIARSRRRGR